MCATWSERNKASKRTDIYFPSSTDRGAVWTTDDLHTPKDPDSDDPHGTGHVRQADRRPPAVPEVGAAASGAAPAGGVRWRPMLGDQEAIVLEVRPFDLHGVTYHDVTVTFPDQTVEQARLGPEGVPANLQPGERVLATRVANMVISLRRP